jgi:hypothetical protein
MIIKPRRLSKVKRMEILEFLHYPSKDTWKMCRSNVVTTTGLTLWQIAARWQTEITGKKLVLGINPVHFPSIQAQLRIAAFLDLLDLNE